MANTKKATEAVVEEPRTAQQKAAAKQWQERQDNLTGYDIRAIEKEGGGRINDEAFVTSPDFIYAMLWRYKMREPDSLGFTIEQALSLSWKEAQEYLFPALSEIGEEDGEV